MHGTVLRAILPTTGAETAHRAIPLEERGHILLTTGGTDPDHTLRITAEGRDPDPGLGPLTVATASLQLEGYVDPTPETRGPILLNAQFPPTIEDVITDLFPEACRQGEVLLQ